MNWTQLWTGFNWYIKTQSRILLWSQSVGSTNNRLARKKRVESRSLHCKMLKVNEQAIELQHLQRTHILQLFFSLFKREEVFRVNIGAHRAHRFTLIATWREREKAFSTLVCRQRQTKMSNSRMAREAYFSRHDFFFSSLHSSPHSFTL